MAGTVIRDRRLLVATTNSGKMKEIGAVLGDLGIRLVSLNDLPGYEPPRETGTTFAENAVIKACHALHASGLPALADDSGLEVDALDGAPGVHSARYGGEELSDEERCRLLLRALEGVPQARRTARFRAVLALCLPGEEPRLFEGTVEGWIGFQPRGNGGFGYDPIFYLRGEDGRFLDRTTAELTRDEKNAISHRGKALRKLRAALERGEIPL